MPAKGNKFKVDRNLSVVGKILSRKQKKRLEQIVDKKKKKEGRAELIEALTSVQISSLEGYESLSSVQTKGVKRQLVESKENIVLTQTEESNTVTTPGEDATALSRKRKRKVLQQKIKVPKRSDVVGFESESSETDSEDETDEDVGQEEEEDSSVTSSQTESLPLEKNDENLNDIEEREEYVPKRRDDDDKIETIAATSHKPSGCKVMQVYDDILSAITSSLTFRLWQLTGSRRWRRRAPSSPSSPRSRRSWRRSTARWSFS